MPRKKKSQPVKPAPMESSPVFFTDEYKEVFKEVVKFEAKTGKPWWTFAHPKETWESFKRRGCPIIPTLKPTKVESTMENKPPKVFDPKKVAQDIRQHLEAAVGDIASDMLSNGGGFNNDIWDTKIKKAKKQKIQDLQGWLADELYNDPDTLQDLMGDKLYEGCDGDKLKQLEVLNILRTNAHAGMIKACATLEASILN